MADFKIEKTIPTFAVPDLQLGVDFYGRLGFVEDWRWPEDKPTHAGLMLGDCSIMLAECQPAVLCDIYFIVDDVDACYAAVLAGKSWELAPVAGPKAARPDAPPPASLARPEAPKEQPYGLRDFHVIDPSGHHLAFGQVVAPPAAG